MISPKEPTNEAQRLRSLHSLKILDTPPEERFDRFTRLALALFKVPIAFISMIDSERQWFKSCYGMSSDETSRDVSFCGHTILGSDAFVVHDTLEDERFRDNPLVLEDPALRFYAGYPLKSAEGYNIGTLCIADTSRRTFTAAEQLLLRDVAGIVESELNLAKVSDLQTQLQSLNEILTEREQSQQVILQTISDGIISIDETGAILFANEVAHRLFGYAPGELFQKKLDLLVPEYLRQLHANGLKQYVATGKKHMASWLAVGLPGLHRDGHEVPLEISFGEISVHGRRRFTGIIRDVSRQMRDKQELQTAMKKAEDALASRNSFFARMSHEIRTPLSGVVGLIDVLSHTALADEQQTLVADLKQSAHHLSAIATDILDLAKIEAGQIRLLESKLSLRDVLQSVVGSVLPAAQKQETKISLSIDPEVPDKLFGDPVRLKQIVLNLCSNAVKFTDHGSVMISARALSRDQQAITVEIEVRDTGIGIGPEYLPQIFDAYSQAHYEFDGKYGGTGLGLAIVKQLVDLHRGAVVVASEPGVGTTVTVRLPLGVPPPAVVSSPAEDDAAPGDCLKGKHILIIEDDEVNQLVAKKTLGRFGATSREAFRALDGISMLRGERFDLVLMDVQMFGMDGFEATRIIRKSLPPPMSHVPIVAMTASALVDIRERCLDAGMDDHVTKPFEPARLYGTLCRALEKGNIRSAGSPPPEVEQQESEETIDLSYLQSIAGGDDSFMAASARAFVEDSQAVCRQMREAIQKKDLTLLPSFAHKLKAALKMVGLHRSAAILAMIEEDAEALLRDGHLTQKLMEVEDGCQAAIRALKAAYPSMDEDMP